MSGWRAGEWHHLAFTYSAPQNFMRFYVDGVLTAENNEGHYWAPDGSGSQFLVGGDLYANAAYYLVDEFRISSRPADAAEIAARAHRVDAPQPNEVWLATSNVVPGTQLVFEFTPATTTQTGAVCQSASLAYVGIPITNVQPPSTLLPVGTTSLSLRVETADEHHLCLCRRSASAILPDDAFRLRQRHAPARHEHRSSQPGPQPRKRGLCPLRRASGLPGASALPRPVGVQPALSAHGQSLGLG